MHLRGSALLKLFWTEEKRIYERILHQGESRGFDREVETNLGGVVA